MGRYTIISADCYAGGDHDQNRECLDAAHLTAFDEWRVRYQNWFKDLQDEGRARTWDGSRHWAGPEADGIVAEAMFPNPRVADRPAFLRP